MSCSDAPRHFGEVNVNALMAATNYANTLVEMQRFKEARKLMRKTIPVARRVVGESHDVTLKMRWNYGETLYKDPASTLDDLRKAATTLEETERIARRVFGGAHPLTKGMGGDLRDARAALRARETAKAP